MTSNICTLPSVRIDCQHILERSDMTEFRKRGDVATWNKRDCGAYRDIFTIYDHGEGPDKDAMPLDVWQMIERACEQEGVSYGIVWLSDIL